MLDSRRTVNNGAFVTKNMWDATFEIKINLDEDGDGVANNLDSCLNTGSNEIVSDEGCSIAQYCPCDGPELDRSWRNHGAFMTCTRDAIGLLIDQGHIQSNERGGYTSIAAQSSCGR